MTTLSICWYRFLGRGLFTIPDFETWKPRRQLYDPAFKKRSVYHCPQAAIAIAINNYVHALSVTLCVSWCPCVCVCVCA